MAGASTFELLPAIDLIGGRVVRLREGDFARATDYGADPVEVARAFVAAGAAWIHIVDLDGARSGTRVQAEVVRGIVSSVGEGARCQVAGGLRAATDVVAALGDGAARVVLGTAALGDPSFSQRLVEEHGNARIVVALDIRDGLALGDGWRVGAPGIPAADALRTQAAAGVTTFAVTAIDRDGLLGGPDLDLLERLVGLDCGRIIASGGVTTIDDLLAVRAIGCSGAIVGRALYEGRISLPDALAAVD
ncbi:MAG: 1-(5-phosphoribosyl)-5-[(5-phosphoribosylamino)methylideneamino] imidazole-4-carboxamide isomerase [Chloroflexota bacterium]